MEWQARDAEQQTDLAEVARRAAPLLGQLLADAALRAIDAGELVTVEAESGRCIVVAEVGDGEP